MRGFDRVSLRAAVLAAIVLGVATLSRPNPAFAGDAMSHTIDVSGVSRNYLLYVPPGQSVSVCRR